jgi:hypothetical protein
LVLAIDGITTKLGGLAPSTLQKGTTYGNLVLYVIPVPTCSTQHDT